MRILVYGDRTDVLWHPLSGLQPWISALKEAGHQVVVTEDYPEVTLEWLGSFDVCVNYIDNWEHRGSKEAEQVFCQYLEQGGRMLTIHTGIILPGAEQLLDIHGAEFHHHPEAEEITFCPGQEHVEGQELLLEEVQPFSLVEEPYMFTMRKEGKQIYFWYTYRQEWYPAAWTVKVGTGKLVYIAPGHNEAVCGHSMIQRMYDNALAYLQV